MTTRNGFSLLCLSTVLIVVLSLVGSVRACIFWEVQEADVKIVGETDNDKAGFSLASGDIDGDGIDDIIVGSPGIEAELGRKGAPVVYVIYGAESMADSVPLPPAQGAGVTIVDVSAGELLGFSLASGDIDGDDYDDVLIGDPTSDPLGRENAGKVSIVYGSPTLPDTVDLSSPGDVRVTSIFGKDETDKCGFSLVTGDVINNPRADVIIGAPHADPSSRIDAGEVYVIAGSATLPVSVDLASPSGITLTTIQGANVVEKAGRSVALGNINGAGKKDLLLGAPDADNEKGRIYGIYGGSNLPSTIDLASYSDVVLRGTASSGKAGFSLASGDLNGDAVADLLIGAPYADRVYAVYGGSLPDTIDLGTQADVILSGETPGDKAGYSLFAANITGDELGGNQLWDLIIGAPGVDDWKGRSFVVFGRQDLPSTVTLDSASVDMVIVGQAQGDQLGFSVASGNLNGDSAQGGASINDLIISSPMSNAAGEDAGMIYIIKGFELPELLWVTPSPNSVGVDPLTSISATFNVEMDTTTIGDSTFHVYGSQTGSHVGNFSFADANKTVLFAPDSFAHGEVVTVVLADKMKSSKPSIRLAQGYGFSFTVQTSYGSGEFAMDTTLTVPVEPRFVFGADFDNDGDIDMVSINSISDDFTIVVNEDCGTWSVDASYAVLDDPRFCYCGDLDRDGDDDIAVTNSYSDKVSIFYNEGVGTFTNGGTVNVGDFPLDIGGGDLDGNGYIDLTVANAHSDFLSILLNQGDSTFVIRSIPTGDNPNGIAVADVDKDWDMDIVVVNEDSDDLCVYLNDGRGYFAQDTCYFAGVRPTALYANDFDADGWIDIATVNVTVSPSSPGAMMIFLSDGYGSFYVDSSYQVRRFPYAISGGDLDGDGDVDLVQSNLTDMDVIVFLNEGDGSFVPLPRQSLGGLCYSVSLFDYNCDGDVDLVSPLANLDSVAVLENLAPSPKVLQTSPNHNDVHVLTGTDIRVTFDLKMRVSSFVDTLSFIVQGSQTGLHQGTFQLAQDDYQVIFDPDEDFSPGEEVTVTLTTGIKSEFPEIMAMKRGYTLCFTIQGGGSGIFSSNSNYDVGSGPRYAYGGDLNDDGFIDLAVSNYDEHSISVLINAGAEDFTDSTYGVGTHPRGISGCDLDNDGNLDLIVVNEGSNNVSICWGGTTGTFAPPFPTMSVGAAPFSAWCGDLDNDGWRDIAVVNAGDNSTSILWNEGNRQFFSGESQPTGNGPRSIAGIDLNSDNLLDLATANYGGNDVTVLINEGGRSFSEHPRSPFGVGVNPLSICSADFNADNCPDMAVANEQEGYDQRISVLINDACTTFVDQATYGVPKNPNWVASADITGEGCIDLVVPNWYSSEYHVSALFNDDCDGTFELDTLSRGVKQPNFIYPADFNGDGFVDLAVVSTSDSQVVILWNFAPAPLVVSTEPAMNAVGVPTDGSISVTFDRDMNISTVDTNTFAVAGSQTGTYWGQIRWENNTATFDPHDNFAPGELITVSLTTGIRSSHGAKMENGYVFSFVVEGSDGACEFDSSVNIRVGSLGSHPRYIVAGDFNRDGQCDLVTSNEGDDSISLLLNNGDTTFTELTFDVIDRPYGLAVADFDRDVDLDLAVVNHISPAGYISVLLNDRPDTSFTSQNYLVGDDPSYVFAGDLNGNGYPDLAVTNEDSAFTVRFNDGNGHFSDSVVYPLSGDATWVDGRDLDNDGDMDLCVTSYQGKSISIFENRGDGALNFDTSYAVERRPQSLTCNDLDGDGLCDMAVVDFTTSTSLLIDTVTVFRNIGGRRFEIDARYAVGNGPVAIISSDFNGDGWIDLAVANEFTDDVVVLENRQDGSFQYRGPFSVDEEPMSVCGADFNGDGCVDLATANWSSDNVSLVLKSPCVEIRDLGPETRLPLTFSLSQNFPNPFNPATEIAYTLPQESRVRLTIYNILGQKVIALVDERQQAGHKSVLWDSRGAGGAEAASGLYFYRISAGDFVDTRKMILLR